MSTSNDTTFPFPIPGLENLSSEGTVRLHAMMADMKRRGLPPEIVASGIRSTAALLLEQEEGERARIDSNEVQEFIEANAGKAVSRTPRAAPRRESKVIARDQLHERLNGMLTKARTSRRKHEVLSVRRDLLALDQAHIRRVLGVEGDAICTEVNEWLTVVAERLNRGTL